MDNMFHKLVCLALATMLLPQMQRAQERLIVTEPNPARTPLLSRIASIDSRQDSFYIVYANADEKKALQQAIFRYEEYPENPVPKGLTMANDIEEMEQWDHYPTYGVYQQMMQRFATEYPSLCSIDTIGTSVQGRLILCAKLSSRQLPDSTKPQFFYSSTIHGDELAGFQLMLHLIDTLLAGYGTNSLYTHLLDSLQIYINPLANPDGTYHSGDNAIGGSQRYNANNVDLNRNYPDPFGSAPLTPQQPENTAMITYFQAHRFRLSANLHGGSEVLNYPWDSFESSERLHPSNAWWKKVCKQFIDTLRSNQSEITMTTVLPQGYIVGGDWYVIPNGRQDWVNAKMDCLEMTMEISLHKKLPSSMLPAYWKAYQHPFVNYIYSALRDTTFLPDTNDDNDMPNIGIAACTGNSPLAYPNPTTGHITLTEVSRQPIELLDTYGHCLLRYPSGTAEIQLRLPSGIYILRCGNQQVRIMLKR